MPTDLRYLVARNDEAQFPIVTIRAFDPADHPNTTGMDKAEAWARAQKFAKPIKLVRNARRKAHPAASIEFQGTDGMRTVVQTAQATQDKWEAVNREAKTENISDSAIDNQTETGKVSPMPATATTRSASEPQRNFIRSLITERLDAAKAAEVMPAVDNLNMTQASAWINRLKELPKQTNPIFPNVAPTIPAGTTTNPEVPAGHYAIGGADGSTKFYKVDRPTEGKWAGFTFVKVQASDDYFPVKGAAKHTILAAIAADPRAASIRYGQEIGKCGVCNRTLTDPDSIAAGIGPVCADKAGW